MTAPDNDDLKRAEEIKFFLEPEGREAGLKHVALLISEERARTLNSEAVQGLVDALREIEAKCESHGRSPYSDCEGVSSIEWIAELTVKKFQQFKDGK